MLGVLHLRRLRLLNQMLLLPGQLIFLEREVLSSDWLPSHLQETQLIPLHPRPLLVVPLTCLICKNWGYRFHNIDNAHKTDDLLVKEYRTKRHVDSQRSCTYRIISLFYQRDCLSAYPSRSKHTTVNLSLLERIPQPSGNGPHGTHAMANLGFTPSRYRQS